MRQDCSIISLSSYLVHDSQKCEYNCDSNSYYSSNELQAGFFSISLTRRCNINFNVNLVFVATGAVWVWLYIWAFSDWIYILIMICFVLRIYKFDWICSIKFFIFSEKEMSSWRLSWIQLCRFSILMLMFIVVAQCTLLQTQKHGWFNSI